MLCRPGATPRNACRVQIGFEVRCGWCIPSCSRTWATIPRGTRVCFGMGIDLIAMFTSFDIRLLYENDVRFLSSEIHHARFYNSTNSRLTRPPRSTPSGHARGRRAGDHDAGPTEQVVVAEVR